jgi:UDP-N-acetylmuramoylalanine--D-glutamate ligase
MDINNKKIGIWGFGIVGKSVATFLHDKTSSLQIMDKRSLTNEEKQFLKNSTIVYLPEDQREIFLTDNDLIIPSSGIDLRHYQQFQHKFISELDLFGNFFSKPIIAITGTLGKTTLTTLLARILDSQGVRITMGGNIGIGLCDLIANQEAIDCAVLEVSSFQLELSKTFTPELAIWTNFYPNHLDRHNSIDDYVAAKLNILRYQKPHQKSLLPCTLLPQIAQELGKISPAMAFFSSDKPEETLLKAFKSNHFFWIEDAYIVTQLQEKKDHLIPLAQLPKNIFVETTLILIATLNILRRSLDISQNIMASGAKIEHRLEYVTSINGISFYNDSKATVPEAMLAAVNKLQPHKILLLLGGLSKGIDRKPSIQHLKNKVSHVFCFGAEADQLYQWCIESNISASAHKSLEQAFQASIHQAKSGNNVLLSPGGSSFDLFANYQERGNVFKKLIKLLENS